MAGPLVRLRLRVSCGGFFRGRRGVVHHVFQFLAWLEIRNLLGGHLDARSGLGVAPDAGLPLARAEATKAADLDLVTAAQGFHDAVEDGLDDDLRLLAGHFHYARDLFNQIRLGHVHASLCKLLKNLCSLNRLQTATVSRAEPPIATPVLTQILPGRPGSK